MEQYYKKFQRLLQPKLSTSSAYLIVSLIATFMTIFNYIDHKQEYMLVSSIFAISCAINFLLSRFGKICKTMAEMLLFIEVVALFIYLLVGSAGSISVMWICLLPVGGVLFFGFKKTIWLCLLMLAALLFIFFTPGTEPLTIHFYPLSIRLRLLIFFIFFSAVALFLEQSRKATVDELTKLQEKFHHLYLHDALTGALSRHAYDEAVTNEFGKEIGFILVDIDYFKEFNDSQGHYKGDLLLKKTANIISGCTDNPVFRWGGDEFAILLPTGNDVRNVAEKVCNTFENEIHNNSDFEKKATVSVGAVLIKSSDITSNRLFKEADKCLYQAKEQGRNCVIYKEITL